MTQLFKKVSMVRLGKSLGDICCLVPTVSVLQRQEFPSERLLKAGMLQAHLLKEDLQPIFLRP